jgi:hypothetical protein
LIKEFKKECIGERKGENSEKCIEGLIEKEVDKIN